jgi:ferrous iron transport protein B
VPGNTPAAPPPTSAPSRKSPRHPHWIALTGNPNCGKTTLFNALTGLRARVGNYAGVTVERKEGRVRGSPPHLAVTLLDLPGTYSLSAQSEDERIARDVLLHRQRDVAPPNAVVIVVDASNLERNLYYATQVIELGHPTFIALNMTDVARENGHDVNPAHLATALGVPVFPMVASTGEGVAALRDALIRHAQEPPNPTPPPPHCPLPPPLESEVAQLAPLLHPNPIPHAATARSLALLLLTDPGSSRDDQLARWASVEHAVLHAQKRLEEAGIDWHGAAIEARYAYVAQLHDRSVIERLTHTETLSDRIDRWITHRIWGPAIFIAIMAGLFQSIFTFAQAPMDLIESTVASLGTWVATQLPPGDLNSLLVDGVISGVGAVVVFLPQIVLLFLFIGLLEDTGYMARAAFLMDQVMSRVGLHGKSFIPLLSSFACAIPGIMATRTIESPKDRLATILVAPLMSCSARLPVYALLIAACIPDLRVLGFLRLQGLTLMAMYLLGIIVALAMAWLFKHTLLRSETPLLIMELPPYRRPVFRVVLRHLWDRAKIFLQRAGTVILAASIILWFLASYPRSEAISLKYDQLRSAAQTTPPDPQPQLALQQSLSALNRAETAEQLRQSFAGRLGHLIEPAIAPLGFDWQIGVGIVASFAAREIFVSTMATVYNVGQVTDPQEDARLLADTFRAQQHPDGSPVYTLRTALALMVFFVFALQCVSTVAIVRRETQSWWWPAFQWLYMGALAWIFAFATYHLVPLLGWT